MTQHRWQTTDGFEVLAGWDRPLQHYFFQISRLCPSCVGTGETETGATCFTCGGRGEQYLFDNLDAKEFTDALGGMTIANVQKVLEKYLTNWPAQFLTGVRYDSLNDLGNQQYTYEPVGTVKYGQVGVRT